MRLHPTADDPWAQALVPQGTHDQAVVMVAFGLENRQGEQAMKELAWAVIICCAIFYSTAWVIGPPTGGWWCA